ncbi:MAG: dTDP-4-dehydrorhamnose 3,5-epimerase family protein [bacterium]
MTVPDEPSRTPGVRVIRGVSVGDDRGRFCKVLTPSFFGGSVPHFEECFWSQSGAGVVRGFHLQLPPADHDKLVFCMTGAALDVVLDLRVGSPQYGCAETIELLGGDGRVVFIPRGVAHAFQALTDSTILCYLTSSAHDVTHDAGIHWESAGVEWPLPVHAVSARDSALPRLADFRSPFTLGDGTER